MKHQKNAASFEKFRRNFPKFINDLEDKCLTGKPFSMSDILEYREIAPAHAVILRELGIITSVPGGKGAGLRRIYSLDRKKMEEFEPNFESFTTKIYELTQDYYKKGQSKKRAKDKKIVKSSVQAQLPLATEHRTPLPTPCIIVSVAEGIPHIERNDFTAYQTLGLLRVLTMKYESFVNKRLEEEEKNA